MIKGFRSLVALFCCTAITLLNGGARAEEEIDSSARSAIVIERHTGQVLLSHNAHEPLPMASTTKVMTALAAIEYGKLDENVTVSSNAYGVPGTSIYLNLGEKVTLRDLLYGLMLSSGNDAAVAIAEHIGGDTESFCEAMTRRAAQIGCTDTVFVNPHGLPVKGHHTTAADLALIAREAMGHELFREIVSTQRASIPWEGRSYPRILNNKNKLLSFYKGATGVKTGYTKAAGRCLVFGARRDGLEVIGVVLNCADWFEEAARLMDQAFELYENHVALEKGETVRVIPVTDGKQETVRVCAAETLQAPVKKGQLPVWLYELPDQLPAGVEEGQQVGEAKLMQGEKTLAGVPLIAGESIARRDYGYELVRIGRGWPSVPETMTQ